MFKYNITHTLDGSSSSSSILIHNLVQFHGSFLWDLNICCIEFQTTLPCLNQIVGSLWTMDCDMHGGAWPCTMYRQSGGLTYLLGPSILSPHPMFNLGGALPWPSYLSMTNVKYQLRLAPNVHPKPLKGIDQVQLLIL